MTLENVVSYEEDDEDDDDDVPLAEVEVITRSIEGSRPEVSQDTPLHVPSATRSASGLPSSRPPPTIATEPLSPSSPSGRKASPQTATQLGGVGVSLTADQLATRERRPTPSPPGVDGKLAPGLRSPSRGEVSQQTPVEPVTLKDRAGAGGGSETRLLRSASRAPLVHKSPAPAPRSHSRGKGGQQPRAERAALGEGLVTGAAASSVPAKREGDSEVQQDESGGSDRPAELERGTASGPGAIDHIPKDILQLFAKLRTGSKAYQWRPPAGTAPHKIPAGSVKTANDIRAAHTDAAGNIISYADLTELHQDPNFLGLEARFHRYKCPCNHCRSSGLECYYWNRTSCTNCYATRTKCVGGIIPDGVASDPHKGKKASIYEPRPERRFYLLKQLEDVMGGWDPRLNSVGGKPSLQFGVCSFLTAS